jgi:gamma-glutamylcyclotransferase (GGCT)/AIG2-like uncharacterized protein YtfP
MYLAVYGTLRKGFPLHYLLKKFNAKFIGFGSTDPLFNCYYGVYPICKKGGKTRVFVEVYEVDEETLRAIDVIEAGYVREIVRVYVNSDAIDVYMYIYEEGNEIPNDFKLFEGSIFNFADVVNSNLGLR